MAMLPPLVEPVLIHGDCREVLKTLPENHFDALICDPPAGVGFMGKAFDSPGTYDTASTTKDKRGAFIEMMRQCFVEVYRVMKPGSHGFIWALPRTIHWTMMALEDAGLDIRDIFSHLYSSGFPKGQDSGKQIDRAAGVERTEVIGLKPGHEGMLHTGGSQQPGWDRPWKSDPIQVANSHLRFEPVTEEAKQWEGWNTALKPSREEWILVRKPLSESSIAANLIKYGVGSLNIDACRIACDGGSPSQNRRESAAPVGDYNGWNVTSREGYNDQRPGEKIGRFPSHTAFSHAEGCARIGCKKVKGSNGIFKAGERNNNIYGKMNRIEESYPYSDADGNETVEDWDCVADCPVRMLNEQSSKSTTGNEQTSEGIASRFFYCSKPSRAERNLGLDDFEKGDMYCLDAGGSAGKLECFSKDERGRSAQANVHPTVKPSNLLNYLIKLICPPGGKVLDCFMGSGSTGIACVLGGWSFTGIEKSNTVEEPYFEIASRRIARAVAYRKEHPLETANPIPVQDVIREDREAKKPKKPIHHADQESLFDF